MEDIYQNPQYLFHVTIWLNLSTYLSSFDFEVVDIKWLLIDPMEGYEMVMLQNDWIPPKS